jgi:hypothetical protein
MWPDLRDCRSAWAPTRMISLANRSVNFCPFCFLSVLQMSIQRLSFCLPKEYWDLFRRSTALFGGLRLFLFGYWILKAGLNGFLDAILFCYSGHRRRDIDVRRQWYLDWTERISIYLLISSIVHLDTLLIAGERRRDGSVPWFCSFSNLSLHRNALVSLYVLGRYLVTLSGKASSVRLVNTHVSLFATFIVSDIHPYSFMRPL